MGWHWPLSEQFQKNCELISGSSKSILFLQEVKIRRKGEVVLQLNQEMLEHINRLIRRHQEKVKEIEIEILKQE